jgi:hypothetical protein
MNKTKKARKKNQRNQQGEVMNKQLGNKTNKHIKKFQVQEQQNFSLSSSDVTSSASIPGVGETRQFFSHLSVAAA